MNFVAYQCLFLCAQLVSRHFRLYMANLAFSMDARLLFCTGQRERDHCNAHDTPYWTAMRAHMRASNEALAVAEFRASGPLQVPKLPGK